MERVIVAGVDRSDHSRAAAHRAAHEALVRGLALRVVHVTPADGRGPYRRDAVVDRTVAELTGRYPALTVRGACLAGAPAEVLRSAGRDAELVVAGLRGEGGPGGTAVGSTASALASGCAAPLLLVPGARRGTAPPRHRGTVAVGLDARDPAAGALGFAFEAARLHGAPLHAVHAWALPAGAVRSSFAVSERDRATWEDHEVNLLSDALRPWRGKYPEVDVVEDVVLFTPAQALVHVSADSALVVAGRRTASGATLAVLLEHAGCPVAVVPVR
ncbi:UspA domain-containing protein [Actinobacteria bacterium OK074]|nr:UspA domain-containing protein [Actinobacteria bacterium OK074]